MPPPKSLSSHAQLIAKRLTASGHTLATAESCTGGLIAHTLTNIPGSSAFFIAGVIAYAYEAKTNLLGVPRSMLERNGAVSSPVVKAMATGMRKRFKAEFAIATTGIAGPAGGTETKPVGLVFIAVAAPQKTIIKRFVFQGTRLSIKSQTAKTALNMLLETL